MIEPRRVKAPTGARHQANDVKNHFCKKDLNITLFLTSPEHHKREHPGFVGH